MRKRKCKYCDETTTSPLSDFCEIGWEYEKDADVLFSINRTMIDGFDLKMLAENISKITELVNLKGIVEAELEEEEKKEFEEFEKEAKC